MATPPRRRYAPRLPRDERRRQILDVTLLLIARHGYGGVSMQAVAREAGVTKPVVYDMFANRGELLRALLEREEARALGELAGALRRPAGDDPDRFFVEGLTAFLQAVVANPHAWRLILLPADSTPPAVREHVARGREAIARVIEELVDWGIRERGGPDLDTELAAHAILALGEQVARLVLTDPERYTTERVGAFAATLMGALARSP